MSTRTTFRYPNTCPTIDKNIDSFRDALKEFVEEFFNEYNPAIRSTLGSHSTQWYDLLNYKVDELYNQAEPIFENVRTCNSDMRDEINDVIEGFVDEIGDLERELKDVNYELEKSADRVNELEDELQEAYERIKDLENGN